MSTPSPSVIEKPLRILITGGWGTTARRLARLLSKEETAIRLVLTSRSGCVPAEFEHCCVRFDWFDPGTYDAIFRTDYGPIDRAYLVAPPALVRVRFQSNMDLCDNESQGPTPGYEGESRCMVPWFY